MEKLVWKHFGKPPTLSSSPPQFANATKKKARTLFLSTGHWSVLRNNVVAFFLLKKKQQQKKLINVQDWILRSNNIKTFILEHWSMVSPPK